MLIIQSLTHAALLSAGDTALTLTLAAVLGTACMLLCFQAPVSLWRQTQGALYRIKDGARELRPRDSVLYGHVGQHLLTLHRLAASDWLPPPIVC
ncbi:hypothetical protein FKM82_002297 [Ascaphus truei]